jgi:iron complex transport system ATP-binding protein
MLELKELCCGYQGKAVVENLSFDVSLGDIVCILGANGVGKTTLYRTILNMLPPVSGQVTVNGTISGK